VDLSKKSSFSEELYKQNYVNPKNYVQEYLEKGIFTKDNSEIDNKISNMLSKVILKFRWETFKVF
jgi:hypothetical protein